MYNVEAERVESYRLIEPDDSLTHSDSLKKAGIPVTIKRLM